MFSPLCDAGAMVRHAHEDAAFDTLQDVFIEAMLRPRDVECFLDDYAAETVCDEDDGPETSDILPSQETDSVDEILCGAGDVGLAFGKSEGGVIAEGPDTACDARLGKDRWNPISKPYRAVGCLPGFCPVPPRPWTAMMPICCWACAALKDVVGIMAGLAPTRGVNSNRPKLSEGLELSSSASKVKVAMPGCCDCGPESSARTGAASQKLSSSAWSSGVEMPSYAGGSSVLVAKPCAGW